MKKHYDVLGLIKGASQNDIQTAYEKLSSELNPEDNNNETFFVEEYRKVQEAYQALSNSSLLATEKGSKNHKSQGPDLKQKESLNDQPPEIISKTSKRDYAFGVLLFFIATGIWGVFFTKHGVLHSQ